MGVVKHLPVGVGAFVRQISNSVGFLSMLWAHCKSPIELYTLIYPCVCRCVWQGCVCVGVCAGLHVQVCVFRYVCRVACAGICV